MTNKDRTLDLLRSGGWVHTGDFLRQGCGSRFGARIAELRNEGYEIVCEAVRPGAYRYRLSTDLIRCWTYTQWAPEGERWKLESVDLSAWGHARPAQNSEMAAAA